MKKLANILQSKYGQKDDLSRQLEIVKVFDIFKAEAGKIFPKQTPQPISFKNKVLTVQTASSAQANELRLRANNIIQSINQGLSKEVVKRVIYRLG